VLQESPPGSPTARTDRAASEPSNADSDKVSARELLVDRYCEIQPQLQRRFSALLHGELREELHAVTDHQLSVLTHLRHNSVTMRELAKQLAVGESAATAVVDRLVRQGLVIRCDDPTDRRVVRLTLSAEGQSVVAEMRATVCRKTASLLDVLSDEQLAQLVAIIETLEAATANDPRNSARSPRRESTLQEQQ
jgi:DNA-binding MarR family transcriptional regulator